MTIIGAIALGLAKGIAFADACQIPLDSLFQAKAYDRVVDCANEPDTSRTPAQLYTIMLSHLYLNHLGRAKAYGDSILPLLGEGPYRDSVDATTRYLHELTTRRTAPPRTSPRAWRGTLGIVHGYESFQWAPGASDWTEIVNSQYRYAAGLVANPIATKDDFATRLGHGTDLEAGAGYRFATHAIRHRLDGFASLGISHDGNWATWGVSGARSRHAAGLGNWEIANTPSVQWVGRDLYSLSWNSALDWTHRADDRAWVVSLTGNRSVYPGMEQSDWQAGTEVSFTKASTPWIQNSRLSIGYSHRSGLASSIQPVRTASCRDIPAGQAASANSITCFLDPTSDSVVAPHPFKGLSGYPYFPSAPLIRRTWTSSVRLEANQSLQRDFAYGRWTLRGTVSYALERSLEPVEWNNGFFGVASGDSLIVLHDRESGRDYLWEHDFRGRFLELQRRQERATLHSGLGQVKLGFRPFARSELFVAAMASRTWSDLPAESGEYGYDRWRTQIGWIQTL